MPTGVPITERASTSAFKAMMRNHDVADRVSAAFDNFPQPFVELNPSQYQLNEIGLEISANIILDTNIYNGRIYLGTDNGLYHGDFDWGRDNVDLASSFTRRSDTKCVSTTVGYGAINASCGDQGLYSGFDEFGWIKFQKKNGLRKVAEKSFRSTWLAYDVVNYTSSTELTLLRTSREKLKSETGKPTGSRQVLTGIGTERVDLGYLLEHVQAEFGVSKESLQYVYNSKHDVFIHTLDGNFYSIEISLQKIGGPKIRFTRTYKGKGTRILSAHPTDVGLIIETDKRVFLFANERWWSIMESAVLSIRTFPRSKRFRNLVALTTEEGLHLVGLFDEDSYVSGVNT